METSRIRDGFAGAAAAAMALGVSELLAGLSAALPSLVEGLGSWVIDNVPKPIKDFAIEVFGTNDKLALLIGIAVVTVLLGAVVGVLSRKRFGIAISVFVGFGILAAWAAAWSSGSSLVSASIPAGAAVLTGLGLLRWLYGLAATVSSDEDADPSRRRFLLGTGAILGLAALTGVVGRSLVESAKKAVSGRSDVVLPVPAERLASVPAAADLNIEGLSPPIVSNDDFYRIDTAFSVPRVDLLDWTLTISGLVDKPYTIGYHDLLDMRSIERDVTLSCVSNDVGGSLVGNARWQGVRLSEILDRAGVQAGAEQIVGRSVDDFTVGFPLEAAYDGREALVAFGMNGEPLPFEHGFPARLVVAGLYGYVSATKWLSEIELTGWEEFDAYWIVRNWSKEGPIKTQSRIDTPRRSARVPVGPTPVAGVAWAPDRGIEKVEVQLGDSSPWIEAELSEPLSKDSWVQWKTEMNLPPGIHNLRVRATDGTGVTQTEEIRPSAPSGATGWHSISVVVEEV